MPQSLSQLPSVQSRAHLLLAAQGIFCEDVEAGGCILGCLEERPFSIRLAGAGDLDALLELEAVWDPALRSGRDSIASRIERRMTYVAVVGTQIGAVLYTQRVQSAEALVGSSFAAMEEPPVAQNDGPVVQLLAIAAAPAFSHLRLGGQLRDFVLQVWHRHNRRLARNRLVVP